MSKDMNIIDLSLYAPEPFAFKTKTNNLYEIAFVSSSMELSLLKEQGDIVEKSKNFKLLEQLDIDRWKKIIKAILLEQKDILIDKVEYAKRIEEDLQCLSPLDVIAILMGLIEYLRERSQVMFQAFNTDTRRAIKEAEENIKKKIIST
jgi:hypothetical protein